MHPNRKLNGPGKVNFYCWDNFWFDSHSFHSRFDWAMEPGKGWSGFEQTVSF